MRLVSLVMLLILLGLIQGCTLLDAQRTVSLPEERMALDVEIKTDGEKDETRWFFHVTNIGAARADTVDVTVNYLNSRSDVEINHGVFRREQSHEVRMPLLAGESFSLEYAVPEIDGTLAPLLRQMGRYYVEWTEEGVEYRVLARSVTLNGWDIGNR